MYFFLYNKDWCDFFKSPYSNWFNNEKRGSSSSGGEALRECSAPTGFAALGALVEARSLWQTQKFRQQGLIPGELIPGAGIPPSPQHRAQGSLSQPSLSSVSVGSLCFLPLVCDFLSACHRSAINGINCINFIDILHSVFCKQPQGLHWTPREGEGLRKELGQKCSRGRAENEPGQNLGGLCWSWQRGESEGLSPGRYQNWTLGWFTIGAFKRKRRNKSCSTPLPVPIHPGETPLTAWVMLSLKTHGNWKQGQALVHQPWQRPLTLLAEFISY